MQLREITADAYARDVLPQTAPMWSGGRDYDTYVEHTLAVARSGYGRRHYRTIGLFDGTTLLASFKRYERIVHDGPRRLRAFGFGAVFTPEPNRGRGYASVLIGNALDRARADGYDVAFLYSDIRPQFYEALGFKQFPSREISLRADSLPYHRIEVAQVEERDWSGVRRCYDLCERRRAYGFARTPLVWEWLRLRMAQNARYRSGSVTNLAARRGRAMAAYVFGLRKPDRDVFEVEEFGFADEEAAAIVPSLLRSAAGDLGRIVGWLPPGGARELLPRGTVHRRKDAVYMMAPLSPDGAQLVRTAAAGPAEFAWATDHV